MFQVARVLLMSAAPLLPQDPATSLTIYSSAEPGGVQPEAYRTGGNFYGGYGPQQVPGYAVVRQTRSIELAAGRSTVRFTDVAALIDATTVAFASLDDPAGTRVLEQNFEFDLVNNQRLLERFLDRDVSVEFTTGSTAASDSGVLLSSSGGFVLKKPDGSLRLLTNYTRIALPSLPDGLLTRPTLIWHLEALRAGSQRCRVSYQTGGITWWADYNVIFTEGASANEGVLDVGAWVSILNQSGASYRDARLKLVAGTVNRVRPEEARPSRWATRELALAAGTVGFTEKAFFEYHLYTLGRLTTLPDRSTKQIELFPPAAGVPCEKLLVYFGNEARGLGGLDEPLMERELGFPKSTKVYVYLRFKNSQAAGLGIPLPAGRVRVSKLDPADQSLEFIGEDAIDHTPKDEPVLVKLGSAFDVVGSRRQVNFRIDTSRRTIEEEVEVKIRNHKDSEVSVLVREGLYRWSEWQITKKSHDFEKLDSRSIEFPIRVPKDGETTVEYTVRYTW